MIEKYMAFVKMATVYLSGMVAIILLVFWLLGAFRLPIDKKLILYWAAGLSIVALWGLIVVMAFFPKYLYAVLPFLSQKTIEIVSNIMLNILFYFFAFVLIRQFIEENYKYFHK